MNKILINGNFLCRNLTGIERFAFETCRELDEMLGTQDDVSILIPKNAKLIPQYKNIKPVFSQKEIHRFPVWDMGTFAKACKKRKSQGLNFANTAPLGKLCGYSFIHDVYAKDHPDDFKTFKDKLVRLYCRISYLNIAKNAKKVFTVSEFSKSRITHWYGPNTDIAVIPNGWEHFKNISEDDSIMKKHKILEKGNFYFTLGSLSKRKNLVWIAKYAEDHPENIFAVSGKAISGLVAPELESLKKLSNVILLGYVSDQQVKCLMRNCKAFVLPSYYEGFGIPPLEALSVGAKIVIANSASLPEIYGKSAYYINPFSFDANLDLLLKEEVESPEKVLEKYTYKNAALLLKANL